MKLAIGTAQFGLDYGVSNTQGEVSSEEIKRILHLALTNGVSVLDTAPSYGSAEKKIGHYSKDFKIVTKMAKLADLEITANSIAKLREVFDQSLSDLQSKNIYGLLIHNIIDLEKKGFELLKSYFNELKDRSLVSKIGVSVYNEAQVELCLEHFIPDLIQFPMNIFDQRFAASKLIKKLKSEGVEIHARSLFLQGLLLMPSDGIHPYFQPIKDKMKLLHGDLTASGVTPLEACIAYVRDNDLVDYMLVGIESEKQLEEIIIAYKKKVFVDFGKYSVSDEDMINPSKWKLK